MVVGISPRVIVCPAVSSFVNIFCARIDRTSEYQPFCTDVTDEHSNTFNRDRLCGDQATINGEVLGLFDSYPGLVFNTFGIEGSDVYRLGLKSVGDTAEEWISLLEVRGPRECWDNTPRRIARFAAATLGHDWL